MKILIACENFYPSIGGVQEVCLQLAKRLVLHGHDTTVVTSQINRNKNFLGIKIVDFNIYGNLARGIFGNKKKYYSFILENSFDIIFIYAAQQWTCDLILNIVDKISAKIFFVPCGFSNLYNAKYKNYFEYLFNKLNFFSGIIFHSLSYRDISIIKSLKNDNLFYIPNGADNNEFLNLNNKLNKINNITFMTNGSFSENKGLYEVLLAFSELRSNLNMKLYINTDLNFVNKNLFYHFKNIFKIVTLRKTNHKYYKKLNNLIKITNQSTNKKVFLVSLNRKELVNLYQETDIFLFASKIEYSPLVIFEAMASKNAIVSHDVGNVKEILNESNAGLIAKNVIDSNGNSIIDINDFKSKIETLIKNPNLIKRMGNNGYNRFISKNNWDLIFKDYENLFLGKLDMVEKV